MTSELVERAWEKAVELLGEEPRDLSALSAWLRTVLLVVSAQGVIDNGGYRYFFGPQWPGSPSYEDFARAYEAIGHARGAAELRRIAATFPLHEPHLHRKAREDFMVMRWDEEAGEVRGWGDALCGDTTVWQLLHAWCERHREALGL